MNYLDGEAGVAELASMNTLFKAANFDESHIMIDPSIVRGLEYYTGAVYEVELTFAVTNEKGETVRFGSVAGGGRYDGLWDGLSKKPCQPRAFQSGSQDFSLPLKTLEN